jgi:hypothetical protein
VTMCQVRLPPWWTRRVPRIAWVARGKSRPATVVTCRRRSSTRPPVPSTPARVPGCATVPAGHPVGDPRQPLPAGQDVRAGEQAGVAEGGSSSGDRDAPAAATVVPPRS